jgi:hypothetical protein
MQTTVERQIGNNFKMKKAFSIHLRIHVLFQFTDIKWIIRIRKREKERQHNDQTKKDKGTNIVLLNTTIRYRQKRLQSTSNVKTGVISCEGTSSSQMKVDIPFPTQMAEQGSVEGVVNALLMHAAWQETHRVNQTSWRGTESILTSNLELSSFRTSAHVGYDHSLNRPSSETPCSAFVCKSSELQFPGR